MTFADADGAALPLLPIVVCGALIATAGSWRHAWLAAGAFAVGLAGSAAMVARWSGPSEAVRLLVGAACCAWLLAAIALAYETSRSVFNEIDARRREPR